jgi:hypothetical protein
MDDTVRTGKESRHSWKPDIYRLLRSSYLKAWLVSVFRTYTAGWGIRNGLGPDMDGQGTGDLSW